jgi:hypothetical protein
VLVYLPSKDIVGNDVTSCIFISLMIILRHEVSEHSGNPGISAIALMSPHAPRTGVRLCVYICIRVCIIPIMS